jgi:hypothetical protein
MIGNCPPAAQRTRTHLINAIRGMYESAPSSDGDPIKAPSLRRSCFSHARSPSTPSLACLEAISNLRIMRWLLEKAVKDSNFIKLFADLS